MLRAAQICGYRHKYLEGILTTKPFRKTISIVSPQSLMASLAMGFDHVYNIKNEFPSQE